MDRDEGDAQRNMNWNVDWYMAKTHGNMDWNAE